MSCTVHGMFSIVGRVHRPKRFIVSCGSTHQISFFFSFQWHVRFIMLTCAKITNGNSYFSISENIHELFILIFNVNGCVVERIKNGTSANIYLYADLKFGEFISNYVLHLYLKLMLICDVHLFRFGEHSSRLVSCNAKRNVLLLLPRSQLQRVANTFSYSSSGWPFVSVSVSVWSGTLCTVFKMIWLF